MINFKTTTDPEKWKVSVEIQSNLEGQRTPTEPEVPDPDAASEIPDGGLVA